MCVVCTGRAQYSNAEQMSTCVRTKCANEQLQAVCAAGFVEQSPTMITMQAWLAVACVQPQVASPYQGPARCSSAGQVLDTFTSLGPQGCLEMWMPSRSSACMPGQDADSVVYLRSAENLNSTVAKIEPSHGWSSTSQIAPTQSCATANAVE